MGARFCLLLIIAGGSFLSDLINIPITETNVHQISLIICLDLSKPEDSLELLKHFLDKTSLRIQQILAGLESRGSKRPKALRNYAWTRFGADHPDKYILFNNRDYITPFPIPVLIVGTKYDTLSSMESERRKLLCKTLRFIAHTNGASLIFVTTKDDATMSKCRQILSNFAFKASNFKTMAFDHTKPISIVAGI